MNLFEHLNYEGWNQWTPRKALSPAFAKCEINGETVLKTASKGRFSDFGTWQCSISGIEGGAAYNFSVEYKSENNMEEAVSIFVLLTWMKEEGELLQRDYVDNIARLENGWKRLQKTIQAPVDAAILKVDLGFRWCKQGSVLWRRPLLVKTEAIPKRVVRVATTYIDSRHDLQENCKAMLEVIDKAGRNNPDIICLTENFYDSYTGLPIEVTSEKIPGKLTGLISDRARKYKSYIVFSMHEKDGDHIYNTAVLIGRNGEIAGKYRKIHLAYAEAEKGVTPGTEYGVFDTDFGRIGLMICWDQAFPETARILRMKGAEIIFIPTIGDEPLQQMARAKDNGVYVVVSGMYGPKSSRIINPMGQIIGEVRDESDGVCIMELDLNKRYSTWWLSLGPCDCEPRSIYVKERRQDTYKPLLENRG